MRIGCDDYIDYVNFNNTYFARYSNYLYKNTKYLIVCCIYFLVMITNKLVKDAKKSDISIDFSNKD